MRLRIEGVEREPLRYIAINSLGVILTSNIKMKAEVNGYWVGNEHRLGIGELDGDWRESQREVTPEIREMFHEASKEGGYN